MPIRDILLFASTSSGRQNAVYLMLLPFHQEHIAAHATEAIVAASPLDLPTSYT